MMKLIRFLTLLILSFCISLFPLKAAALDEELSKLFSDRGVKGAIVISSLDGSTSYVHNDSRAKQRFLPASTFKIYNTLIALDTGAIKDEKEVIKWDGVDRGWDAWNRDQTLETALPVSCVWFYQELAKRVGMESYLKHLREIKYGNQKTGPELTTFWLDGDIRISPVEQVEMLKRVYKNDLPYKKAHLQLLKKLLLVKQTPEYTMRAKTGWALRVRPQIGWYVGWVETKGMAWFFAVNIEIQDKKQAAYRKEIAIEALKIKGII